MFTGIIQTVGEVAAVENVSGDIRLTVNAEGLKGEVIELGDSIACNGVCLTVIEQSEESKYRRLVFDVSRESIKLTLIEQWKVGAKINMELAMLPTTRFGGHMVSGHVDGVGQITAMDEDARSWRIWFKVPDELLKYIAPKGSITIDGISLTVNGVKEGQFHINVVPHTMDVTTMGSKSVGDKVHLEVDLIARYLENLLFNAEDEPESIDEDLLRRSGFLQ